MEEDEELSEEELAEVIEEEVISQDRGRPIATIKARAGSALQSAGRYVQDTKERIGRFQEEQELKKEERAEEDIEKANRGLAQAKRKAQAAELRDEARGYNERANKNSPVSKIIDRIQQARQNQQSRQPRQEAPSQLGSFFTERGGGGGLEGKSQGMRGSILSEQPRGTGASILFSGGNKKAKTPSFLSGGQASRGKPIWMETGKKSKGTLSWMGGTKKASKGSSFLFGVKPKKTKRRRKR